MSAQDKLDLIKEELERLQRDLGWLSWPDSSSTRSAIEDRMRRILDLFKP